MLAALGLLLSVSPAAADASSAAGPVATASGCGSIRLGGESYVFYQAKVGCKQAKKWAGQVFKTRGEFEPSGYDCESGSGFKQGGGCSTPSGKKYFGWHPFD
jgi:hypothetical protein